MIEIREKLLSLRSVRSEVEGKNDSIAVYFDPIKDRIIVRFCLYSNAKSGEADCFWIRHVENGREKWKVCRPEYNQEKGFQTSAEGLTKYRIVLRRSKSSDINASRVIIDETVNLRDSEYQNDFERLKSEYVSLVRESNLLAVSDKHRKLFFNLEKNLRRIMGFAHYREVNCETEHDEKKLLQKIIFTVGCDIFASVYNSGFDIKTGRLMQLPDAVADENIGSGVLFGNLYNAVKSMDEELEHKRTFKKYETFWENIYPVLAEYELDDDDRTLVPKQWEDVCRDIGLIASEFARLGYELKYYEDVAAEDEAEARKFMTGARWGFPAMYIGGALEIGGEGGTNGN